MGMRDTETLRFSGDANSLFREKRIEVKRWAAAPPNIVVLLLRGQTRARPGDTLRQISAISVHYNSFLPDYTAVFQRELFPLLSMQWLSTLNNSHATNITTLIHLLVLNLQ